MQVKINVAPLPSIVNDELRCEFGDFKSEAVMNNRQIVCALPNPVDIPPTPETQGETYLRQNSLTSLLWHILYLSVRFNMLRSFIYEQVDFAGNRLSDHTCS